MSDVIVVSASRKLQSAQSATLKEQLVALVISELGYPEDLFTLTVAFDEGGAANVCLMA